MHLLEAAIILKPTLLSARNSGGSRVGVALCASTFHRTIHKTFSTHFFLLRLESKVPFPILWDLQSSPGNWKWHKVTPLSISGSDYQFDTLGAKIMKMVCFEGHHNKYNVNVWMCGRGHGAFHIYFTSQSTT